MKIKILTIIFALITTSANGMDSGPTKTKTYTYPGHRGTKGDTVYVICTSYARGDIEIEVTQGGFTAHKHYLGCNGFSRNYLGWISNRDQESGGTVTLSYTPTQTDKGSVKIHWDLTSGYGRSIVQETWFNTASCHVDMPDTIAIGTLRPSSKKIVSVPISWRGDSGEVSVTSADINGDGVLNLNGVPNGVTVIPTDGVEIMNRKWNLTHNKNLDLTVTSAGDAKAGKYSSILTATLSCP